MHDTRYTEDGVTLGAETAAVTTTPAKIEGNGETPVRADLCASKRHARADAKMVARAVRNGWPVPDHLRQKVVDRLDVLLDSGDDRTTIAACRAVVEINKQNIDIDMTEDKYDRLDEGKATERIETPIKFIRGTDGSGV